MFILCGRHDCRLSRRHLAHLNNQQFAFDHAFSKRGHADIAVCGGPLVELTRDDGRACIFAYGQTGSGKTYTMRASVGLCTGVSRVIC